MRRRKRVRARWYSVERLINALSDLLKEGFQWISEEELLAILHDKWREEIKETGNETSNGDSVREQEG